MKHKVAIEPALKPIKDYLLEKGYQVSTMNPGENAGNNRTVRFDAFIITGMNTNLAGINDTDTNAIVIDASGMSPEQVHHELQLRLD